MPRHKRLEISGAVYHVIARGIERKEIFKDDGDRNEFLQRLEKGLKRTSHQCYGWVLMPNHFHLLIRSSAKPLSDLMRGLLTGYALYFNRRYRRSGYLYQGRYKSILCQQDSYLLELIRYVHLNPLRGKMVKNIDELNSYPWSGHAVLMGKSKIAWQETGEVLTMFSDHQSEAVKKYLMFVRDGEKMGRREDLIGGGLRRSAGGWEGVLELKKSKERWQGDERILGDGEFVSQILKISEEDFERRELLKQKGWDIEKLVERVCGLFSIEKEELLRRSRLNRISQARELLVYWGKKELGLSGKELGEYLGITKAAVSKKVVLGEKLERENKYKLIS